MSSFMLWMNANRQQIASRAVSPKVPDVAKRAGEEWRAMDEHLKQQWTKRAADLRAEAEKRKRAADDDDA